MQSIRDEQLSFDEINELNEKRIDKMNEAGINELEVLGSAKEDINNWNSYFNENITRGKDDMNFVIRDQWTAIERSEFTRLFKPAMTFNKLYDTVKKVSGEQRKNKPDLMVRSLTGKASQEDLDLRADLVRSVSYQSQNELVYQAAFKSALMMGFGAFQVKLDYESPRSFNQIIKYELISDPTKCAFDPCAIKPHKGDGNFCARQYLFSKDEFYATYPYVINPVSYTDSRMLLDFEWETKDTIVVCDYFKKEWYPTIIYKLSDGRSVTASKWEEIQKQFKFQKELAKGSMVVGGIIMNDIPKIVMERQTQDYKIMHYRLIKDQIIEFSEWPSMHLPIIFVDGDSYHIEGKQYTKSFIHEARDAQKFINYVGSEIAAEIKNRRREQWVVTPDNILGNEQMWRNPEIQIGALVAKPDPKTGMMPQKVSPWDMSPQLMANFQRGTMDIKEILGFFDANQGKEDNAQSGIAIENRQIAGAGGSTVYFDNANQSFEQSGRVVLDLLPFIHGDNNKHVVLTKSDGKSQSIILNQVQDDGKKTNPIEMGEYDIEIDTGPSFAVQKSVALQLLMQLVQTNPQVFPLVADLIAKNLDVQFMPQMVERFKSLVPPEILAKESGQPPPPPKPNPQQQAMQMQMQLQQAELQDRAQELQIRQQKHELEKTKMMMDAQKFMTEVQMSQSDDQLEKEKIMLQAKKLMHDIQSSHADRELDSKKFHMEHQNDLTKMAIDLHKKSV